MRLSWASGRQLSWSPHMMRAPTKTSDAQPGKDRSHDGAKGRAASVPRRTLASGVLGAVPPTPDDIAGPGSSMPLPLPLPLPLPPAAASTTAAVLASPGSDSGSATTSASHVVVGGGNCVPANAGVDGAIPHRSCNTEDSGLRMQVSANLEKVREKIQAVAAECMQELARAQAMLSPTTDGTATLCTAPPCVGERTAADSEGSTLAMAAARAAAFREARARNTGGGGGGGSQQGSSGAVGASVGASPPCSPSSPRSQVTVRSALLRSPYEAAAVW